MTNEKNEKIMEWISVKDKYPEYFTDVLIFYRYKGFGQFHVARLAPCGNGDRAWFENEKFIDYIHSNVTHWMPLQNPPKGEFNG